MTKRSLLEFLQDMAVFHRVRHPIAQSYPPAPGCRSFTLYPPLARGGRGGVYIALHPSEICYKRNLYPQIPWKSIAGTRDIFVHQYWEIDTDVVWSTLQDSLPLLKTVIVQMAAQEEINP